MAEIMITKDCIYGVYNDTVTYHVYKLHCVLEKSGKLFVVSSSLIREKKNLE